MEMFFSSFLGESSLNVFGHPDVERCPFLRNINGATTLSFSSALPVVARGGKGPIFEDGPGFESAFKLFHGRDGIVPLSGRSYVPDENHNESIDATPEPALPFNPLAARAATISLSAFGPFGFNFFNGKGKRQNKKPNNLDQSHKKPKTPDQSSMKKGTNPSSHEALSNEWLENGQCPLARSYRAMSGVLPLVAKALQPPAGMKIKCPPAVVAARAALARTALVKSLRPQPLPAKMVAIALLGMAANIPLGVWREHTKKFSPQWFAAVHAAVPFIAMLRKSVVMPRTAMAFTIAASIVGQTIGSRAERIRLRALAAKGAGDSTTNGVMYPNMNGHCSDTEGKAWDPLATKMGGLATRSSPAPTPGMCF
ncbi:uncharacterized protein LOC133909110 isoform X2 [Phragmites australis]|uniref:uncharacterized protein LOC133909110 isoform X2 n=1 Tax=Phragmites australis TaxID=29695 RepID=UPI002D77A1CB|nr:uncharacterized protein LOC133909110 isoform X2 [Phragmites australis]